MVGLSDIPCVGKVVDRISDAAVDAIFRGFRYMFCTKDLVHSLNSEVEKVNVQEHRVSTKVAAERANGRLIEDHVSQWQKEAEEIKESAREFTERYKNRHSWRCIQCLPIPNPVSRLRFGREAVRKTKGITELIGSGKDLLANEIARLAPDENLPKSNTEFQNFQSRQNAYGQLWEALVSGSSSILGICGMPGVGKTRLMEQVWKEAEDKKIFDIVTRGNVGNERLNVIQLQEQIAGYLNCNFNSQVNEKSRASQLKQSLLNVGKTLIILDDVWWEIPLDIIGIPCGDANSSMGCKILFTSREEHVCLRNSCKTLVQITPLSDDEAWDQFRNIVGTSQIDSMQDESLAKKVCNKCAGLPLLIHAIGKALQFMPYNSWKDALEQLEKGKFENISGIDPQVYACVKLSIDKLPDDAKSCLFLCCLFPEDAYIYISKLIHLAIDSQLVSGESRVLSMVDTLRFSSLLLDCENDNRTKLHDIIRDVGRSIAVRDPKYAFLQVKCGLRLPDDADFGTRKFLRLDLESDNVHIPDDLVCPDLHSLWLKCNRSKQQLSGGLFNMSVNLRFLYVEGTYPPSKLQFSLQSWGKLRTLILDGCDLTNVEIFHGYLEILCIRNSFLPKPLDLSNLKYLRKLEINVWGGTQIMPNTISSLSSLEELHILRGYVTLFDGSEKCWDDSSVAPKFILAEINQLTHLKSLQINFERSEPFQDAHKLFDNLKLFNICVGGPEEYDISCPSKKSIELHGDQLGGLGSLIERAEDVRLECSNINVMSSIFDSNREAFTDLRELYIDKCDNMEHVARMSQGEIQHSQLTSFSKLTCLKIIDCSALRYLFCNSVAKCLTQLQKLTIEDCPVMEAIVMNEGSSNEDIINFSKLKKLKLIVMPRLRSFYWQKKDAMIPSLQSQPLFERMVEFPSLEKLRIENLKDASDIWERNYDNDNSGSSFCKLKELYIHKCDRLETVIPVDMLHRLQDLQGLRISDCSSVTSEVGAYASNTDVWPLLALSHLYLEDLPCLTETGLNSRNRAMTLYPNLKELVICKCDSLRNVFLLHSSFARDVMHLEKIHVEECKMMREIIGKGEQEKITDVVVFPKLTILWLKHLPTLIRCFGGEEANASSKVEFPNLVDFKLISCGEMNPEAIEFGRDDLTCQLQSLEISCDNEIQLPCKWHPRLSNLETLILSRCWWHELKSECFQRLKALEVQYLKCSALFAFSDFKSLQLLERLEISNCAFLEEIVEDDGISGMNKKKTFTLSHLNIVVLKDLPKLKSFFHGANYEFRVPSVSTVQVENCGLSNLFSFSVFTSLQRLYITRCALLEEIVEDIRSDEIPVMDKKTITLLNLDSVVLGDLPKLKSFIYSANHECLMPKLRKVSVSNCGLSSLFMCSAFGSLQNLDYLEVQECRLLEGIFEYARGDETSDTNEQIITLSRLSSVRLKDLPKLKSFIYSANHECLMPKLETVSVSNCGFSSLFMCSAFGSLQNLDYLKVQECRLLEGIFEYARGDETSDTNEQIITLSRLSSVRLKDLPKLKSFIYSANHECLMPKLETVSVSNCGFSSLFMCSAFGSLQNLDYLKVQECRLLEGIFEYARGDETSDTNEQIITLSRLSSVRLKDLPKLKSFIYSANHECLMPKLETVSVSNCGFSSLFMCSAFGSLQNLDYLKVQECRLLEGIFEYARGDETSDTNEQIITLSQLRIVKLIDLPNLKSFIHGANYDCNMPDLEEMEVDNCGFSTLFTCSVFKNLQQLIRLEVSNCKLLEGIVEDARGEETSDTNDNIITLFELLRIKLEHLPKLKSFGQSYAFNMPELGNFHLLGCPMLENFTSLNTKTGVVSVYTERHEPEEVSDVNDYIKQNFRRKSPLSDREKPEEEKDEPDQSAGELSQ